MFQSQARCQAPGDGQDHSDIAAMRVVQSQARCRAPGDRAQWILTSIPDWFQSQARCQAPGDLWTYIGKYGKPYVSISGEMPGPWRRGTIYPPMLDR